MSPLLFFTRHDKSRHELVLLKEAWKAVIRISIPKYQMGKQSNLALISTNSPVAGVSNCLDLSMTKAETNLFYN